ASRCGAITLDPLLGPARTCTPTIGRSALAVAATADQLEVDLAFVEVDPHDPHFHAVAEAEAAAAALARKAMMQRIEMVVIAGHRRDMHQAFDVDIGQLDEQAETGDRGDDT